MKDYQDAFGQAMFDYLRGKGGWEIAERDDGYFAVSGGPRHYFLGYKDWATHQKRAMRYARGKVLDIGCGAGRHALYLQEKGFDVTGIDNSPLAIRVCKLRGLRKARVTSVTGINCRLRTFDTILMLGNNFGLFGSLKRVRRLLRKLHKLTSDRARIIAESNDPYKTANPLHLKYHKLNRQRGRMSGQLGLRIRYQKYATPWFDYLLVSKGEMGNILQGTGWEVVRFLDSGGSVYIAIIEKIGLGKHSV